MVFNDMLFEKSSNVNIIKGKVDNTDPKENQGEHKNSTSSSITCFTTSFNNQEISNSSDERIVATNNNITKDDPVKNLPSQPFVGSGFFGLGIPKSPSFHSGLDLLADDYDIGKISIKKRIEPSKFENINAGCSIGQNLKFSNIDEIKSKLYNSSFSTISAVQTVRNNKMPTSQPQDVNISTNQSQSSNSPAISVTSSTSSLSTTVPPSCVVDAINLTYTTTTLKTMSTTTPISRGTSSPAITNPISATSSIVSTLAQHFNAATSATQLLTTASSTLGSNNKV